MFKKCLFSIFRNSVFQVAKRKKINDKMAQMAAASIEELAPEALTRKVLVEKYMVEYIKKKAIELFESHITNGKQIDQLGKYVNLIEQHLTRMEIKTFDDRILNASLDLYYQSEEFRNEMEQEAEARLEDERNGIIDPDHHPQQEIQPDEDLPF